MSGQSDAKRHARILRELSYRGGGWVTAGSIGARDFELMDMAKRYLVQHMVRTDFTDRERNYFRMIPVESAR